MFYLAYGQELRPNESSGDYYSLIYIYVMSYSICYLLPILQCAMVSFLGLEIIQ